MHCVSYHSVAPAVGQPIPAEQQVRRSGYQ